MLMQFQGSEILLLTKEILFSQRISAFLLVETSLIQITWCFFLMASALCVCWVELQLILCPIGFPNIRHFYIELQNYPSSRNICIHQRACTFNFITYLIVEQMNLGSWSPRNNLLRTLSLGRYYYLYFRDEATKRLRDLLRVL